MPERSRKSGHSKNLDIPPDVQRKRFERSARPPSSESKYPYVCMIPDGARDARKAFPEIAAKVSRTLMDTLSPRQ